MVTFTCVNRVKLQKLHDPRKMWKISEGHLLT